MPALSHRQLRRSRSRQSWRRATDDGEQGAGDDGARTLRHDVADRAVGSDAAAGDQSERHGGVEVAARDVADGKRKGHHGEADRQGDADDAGGSRGCAERVESAPSTDAMSMNVPMNSAASAR